MKFYYGFLRPSSMQTHKKKESEQEILISRIILFLFAITYYPYQYGRMLAYGVISFNYFSDWRGQIPQIIIFGTIFAVILLACIWSVNKFNRSNGFRIFCLSIFFLILEIIIKALIVYFCVVLMIIGICILFYNFLSGFKNKRLLSVFKDVVTMTLLLLIINGVVFFYPQAIRFIFSNELIAAFTIFLVPIIFLILYLSFLVYYLVDYNTYKNILDKTINLKLDTSIDTLKGWIAKTKISLLLAITLLTGILSIYSGYRISELSHNYLIASEASVNGGKSVEVVVYDSGEYYCLENADLLSNNDGVVSIIIHANNYRWVRKDAIKTYLIQVSSSTIQES